MNEKITKWLDKALICEQMKRDGFDSIDINELLGSNLTSQKEQLKTALETYKEVLKQYKVYSNEFRASLVLSLEYTDVLSIHEYDELLTDGIELRQSPEIYINKRKVLPVFMRPLEEYRKTFTPSEVLCEEGFVYSYYSCKYEFGSYTPIFCFEHYASENSTV